MKITNHAGLPQPIVDAVSATFDLPIRSNVTPDGIRKVSVTRLIDSPLIAKLEREHWDEIEQDAADRLWALFGTTLHDILAKAGKLLHLTEESETAVGKTYLMKVPPDAPPTEIRVTGYFDRLCFADGELGDYKVTSAWSILFGKIEWEQQLNVYRHLSAARDSIKALAIYALLRDWSRSRAMQGSDYPQAQFVRVEVPIWTDDEAQAFIHERLKAHMNPEPHCSDKERWARPGSFAVMREGRKSAVRVLESKAEAEAFIAEKGLDAKHSIIQRPAQYVRCESYCTVSKWCPIWQARDGAA